MKSLAIILAAAVGFISVHQSRAQVFEPIPRWDAQNAQQQKQLSDALHAAMKKEFEEKAPELYSGESGDVGPQSVLKIKQRKTWFEASADVQYLYTDNVFYGDRDKESGDVLISTAQVAFAPEASEMFGGNFSPRIGYRHQWFDYGLIKSGKNLNVYDLNTGSFRKASLNEFDFNVQTFFADGRWTSGNWTATLGIDYTRLLSTPGYDQFYCEYVPRWTLQRAFRTCEKSTLTLGYMGDYRFTSVDTLSPVLAEDYNDRTDHGIFGTWTLALCEQSFIQPYYRFTYTHFTAGSDRNDYLNSFGIGIYYFFTQQISARAFVNYDIRRSDVAQDYQKLDAGLGANVNVRF